MNSCLFENPVQKTDEIQEVTLRIYRKTVSSFQPFNAGAQNKALAVQIEPKDILLHHKTIISLYSFMFQSEISTEFMDLLTFKRVANIIQIVQMNKIQ